MNNTTLLLLAITPKTPADQERLRGALATLMTEDPTLRVTTDLHVPDTIIGAGGERHLEIVLDRLRLEFGVEATIGRPHVAYKETLTCPADGEMRFAQHIEGRSQYGHVKIHVDPGAPGTGCVFENHLVGDAIPSEFIEAIHEGITEALQRGVVAGYPIDDVWVQLYDGSYHDGDSSHMAFKIAGSMAFLDAAKKAAPVVLEPMMRVEITMPHEFTAEVMNNLLSRRGQIQSQEDRGGTQIALARVPLSAMFDYARDLRARTHGRGTFVMVFDGYREVPSDDDGRADDVCIGAPRKPSPPLRAARMALPEPSDARPEE